MATNYGRVVARYFRAIGGHQLWSGCSSLFQGYEVATNYADRQCKIFRQETCNSLLLLKQPIWKEIIFSHHPDTTWLFNYLLPLFVLHGVYHFYKKKPIGDYNSEITPRPPPKKIFVCFSLAVGLINLSGKYLFHLSALKFIAKWREKKNSRGHNFFCLLFFFLECSGVKILVFNVLAERSEELFIIIREDKSSRLCGLLIESILQNELAI